MQPPGRRWVPIRPDEKLCAPIGATPALQSAVCDALAHFGVRHIDIPATPEKVWAAISSAGAASGR